MSLWPGGHVSSRDNLEMKYFLLKKTYDHQTRQGADLWWGKAHNEAEWLSDHMIKSQIKDVSSHVKLQT